MLCWGRRPFSLGLFPRGRASTPLALCTTFLIILLIYSLRYDSPIVDPTFSFRPLPASTESQAKFWRSLYTIILNNDPQISVERLEVVVPHKLDVLFDPSHNHIRPDLIWMKPEDIKKMKEAHSRFVKELEQAPQSFFEPATKGIVMTGNLKQLPVLLISIRMLRRTGCVLPVEVFLADDADYDPSICQDILPTVNAHCLVLVDIFRSAGTGVALSNVQYKIMGLLLSTFEDVLLLDHDAFPITDPTYLFTSEPFTTDGMIVWPDFWYPSESPYFFEIAGLGKPPALNERPCMESGEMVFSKAKHAQTLLLAAYYNYYGPNYYYALQAQGAPGQGDKETFAWAARVLQKPFYAVHEPVVALGHVDSNGAFYGSGMSQHDPVQDFEVHYNAPHSDTTFGAPKQRPQAAVAFRGNLTSAMKPLFVHANFPKFDPATIFQYETQKKGAIGPCFDSNNTAVRAWFDQSQMESMFGYDVERAFWEEVEYIGCTLEGNFSAWQGRKDICFGVQEYRKAVF